MFKIQPIFQQLWNHLRMVLSRFPIVILLALTWVILMITFIQSNEMNGLEMLLISLPSATVAAIAVAGLFETHGWQRGIGWIGQIGLAALIVGSVTWSNPLDVSYQESVWGVVWIGVSLCLLLLLPVWRRVSSEQEEGWMWGKSLVHATFLSGLWSGVLLFAGFSILLALDHLFAVSVRDNHYAIWAVNVFGLLLPLFFCARLPRLPLSHQSFSIPKEFQRVGTWLLVPITGIYLIILFAYTGKIWITAQLPEGALASFIIGFSLVGLVTFLVLYPRRGEETWIRHAIRVFFVAMVIQTVMLFVALMVRVNQYGVTEPRYFVGLYGVWLFVVSLYVLLVRRVDVRIFPCSVAVFLIMSQVGPWSALSVSTWSQQARLATFAQAHELVVSGQYKGVGKTLSEQACFELQDFRFEFSRRDRTEVFLKTLGIAPKTQAELDSFGTCGYEFLGLSMESGAASFAEYPFADLFILNDHSWVSLSDYQYSFEGEVSSSQTTTIDGQVMTVGFDAQLQQITLIRNTQQVGAFDLKPLLTLVAKRGDASVSRIDRILEIHNDQLDARLFVRQLSAYQNEEGQWVLPVIEISLLFGLK